MPLPLQEVWESKAGTRALAARCPSRAPPWPCWRLQLPPGCKGQKPNSNLVKQNRKNLLHQMIESPWDVRGPRRAHIVKTVPVSSVWATFPGGLPLRGAAEAASPDSWRAPRVAPLLMIPADGLGRVSLGSPRHGLARLVTLWRSNPVGGLGLGHLPTSRAGGSHQSSSQSKDRDNGGRGCGPSRRAGQRFCLQLEKEGAGPPPSLPRTEDRGRPAGSSENTAVMAGARPGGGAVRGQAWVPSSTLACTGSFEGPTLTLRFPKC